MDVVRSLKDQLHVLKDQNRNLKGKMEEEVHARRRPRRKPPRKRSGNSLQNRADGRA